MPLIPWRPFRELERFFEDEDWLLPVFPKTLAQPAMDLYETDKEVVAEVDLPDIDPDKVDIEVKDGMLRVSGSVEEKKEEKDKNYFRREIRKGAFERMARLPAQVKEDDIDATYKNGVLKIVMPKAETKPSLKKIKVKTA